MNLEMSAYRILLWKAYFDKGFGLLNYLKYVLVVAGFGAAFQGISIYWIIFIAFVYALACFMLGRYWYKHKLIDVENEINNIFNPFQREMRDYIRLTENRKV